MNHSLFKHFPFDEKFTLMSVFFTIKNNAAGNSLVVQWLGLRASTAWGMGSIPGWVTKIPQATRCGQKKKKERK